MRALRPLTGYVDGDAFLAFLRDDLGPARKPGDIVIMDGARIDEVAGVNEILVKCGATAIHLPAYRPERNLIEMTWAWR